MCVCDTCVIVGGFVSLLSLVLRVLSYIESMHVVLRLTHL